MEARHGVASRVGDLLHLLQLVVASCGEVQEGQTIEVLRLLVGLLDDLERPDELVTTHETLFKPSTLWFPCLRACFANRSQQSGRSTSRAISKATSRLPHSIARSKRVLLSWTKCSAICQPQVNCQHTLVHGYMHTSGKPFCCRYAMMLCPSKFDVRMMCSISS